MIYPMKRVNDKVQILTRFHHYHGVKHNTSVDDADSGVHYLILPSSYSDHQCRIIWETLGGDADSRHCSHEHDCCACFFYSKIYIRRVGRRALITQTWGINV